MANVACETRFMPICIGHTQIITIVNFLRTSFANFVRFLTFYGGGDVYAEWEKNESFNLCKVTRASIFLQHVSTLVSPPIIPIAIGSKHRCYLLIDLWHFRVVISTSCAVIIKCKYWSAAIAKQVIQAESGFGKPAGWNLPLCHIVSRLE